MLTLTSRFLGNTFIYLFIYLQCMAPFCLVLFCQIVKQEFSDPRDADDAQYNLDGREVDGSRIIVEFAKGVSCWLVIRFLNDHNIFFQASDLMSMCFDIERMVFQTSVTAGSSWFWWLT